MRQPFDKWLKGTHRVEDVRRVRFPAPDVAQLYAVGGTVMRGKSAPRAKTMSPPSQFEVPSNARPSVGVKACR